MWRKRDDEARKAPRISEPLEFGAERDAEARFAPSAARWRGSAKSTVAIGRVARSSTVPRLPAVPGMDAVRTRPQPRRSPAAGRRSPSTTKDRPHEGDGLSMKLN